MPIPVFVWIGAAVVTGVGGVGLGGAGALQIREAKKQMEEQAAQYAAAFDGHQRQAHDTNTTLKDLGKAQQDAVDRVIIRMRDWLKKHEKQIREREHELLDGIESSNTSMKALPKMPADIARWVRDIVGSASMAVAAPTAVRSGVMALATAGTGTAISSLSGAAATNATLAWLGGGTLASGGGGMAAGALALNALAIGPSLLLGGIALKNRGTAAKTQAEEHRTEVARLIAEINERNALLRAVRKRANELRDVLEEMQNRAIAAIEELEAVVFDPDVHMKQLQEALLLVKGVGDLITAKLLDDDGDLLSSTGDLIIKYRNYVKGA